MGPCVLPTGRPVSVLEIGREVLQGFTRIKLTYDTSAGRVPALLLVPTNLTSPAPAVLCLHQTVLIGKEEPAGVGGDPQLRYAQELAERGVVALAPDYPYFGGNSLDPYEAGYASCTMAGIVNHARAIDVLEGLSYVDAGAIGVLGHSLGGHNGLFLAAFDTRVKAIVSSCGFTSFATYGGGDLRNWATRYYMPRIAERYGNDAALMPFDFSDILSALAPRAVFVNAPLRDANFDIGGVQACVAAARAAYDTAFGAGERITAVFPEAGHEFPAPQREQAYSWLREALTATPPARPRNLRITS